MTSLTAEEFCLLAVFDFVEDFDPEYAEEALETINYDREDEDKLTLEQFEALVDQFTLEGDERTYISGDPTDVRVIKNNNTGICYQAKRYHDSWNGGGRFRDGDYGPPVRVELKQVLVEDWAEVE